MPNQAHLEAVFPTQEPISQTRIRSDNDLAQWLRIHEFYTKPQPHTVPTDELCYIFGGEEPEHLKQANDAEYIREEDIIHSYDPTKITVTYTVVLK